MSLTLSSVMTMCLLSSILILLLCLLYKSDKVLGKIGPACMIITLLIAIIRMFAPFEFFYTYTLAVEGVLSPIRDILTYPIVEEPFLISVWRLLVIIWVVGAFFFMIRKLFQYNGFLRCIRLLPEESWEQAASRYSFDLERYPDIKKTKLVYCNLFSSPYLVGLKNPYIVLPKDDYSNDQFNYIVLHELMHVRNKDIVWKVLIDLLCVAFWWNPIFYLLRRELFKYIEMRNDMQILSVLTEEEKVDYMVCLKNTASGYANNKDLAFGVSFNQNDLKDLARRMKLIVHDNKFNRVQQVVTAIVVILLLFGTSAVIIEPYSDKIPEEEGWVALDYTNTYLIVNGDSYDVYLFGEYVMTTDDLRPFPGVNIYNSIEEVTEDE